MQRKVRVLSLARIYKSKQAVGRPKDIAQLPLLKQTMQLRRRIAPAKSKAKAE